MIGRTIEIAEEGRHLKLHRGFMVVEGTDGEIGRVALDDIGCVIGSARGMTCSSNLVLALAERGAALVLLTPNHLPAAWLWPVKGHHLQNARMRAQVAAGQPLRKRLWQAIVRAKIAQQGAVLDSLGLSGGGFDILARRVRSGDPDNMEAQAARRYWPILMGKEFRRDRSVPGANALLNYGYTVLRAATARSVVAAGLHPTVALHHSNRGDEMALADDLMEPFRPLVDRAVRRLTDSGCESVDSGAKRTLVDVLSHDMATAAGTTPVSGCLERLTASLARSFETGRAALDLPYRPLPLETTDTGMGP